MAARLLTRQRAAPIAAGAALASFALLPKGALYAEAPNTLESRKPIYDDFESLPPTSTPTNSVAPTTPSSPPRQKAAKPSGPTPTDRLAVQIGKTRLFVHAHVAAAEDKVNNLIDSVFHLESSFTSTIASLAPAPRTGEKLMPGSLYVLVAAMTGSIVSRNRNIVLRGLVPTVVGIGAGWIVLPHTMRNVSDLVWKYEQRFPAVADGHLRARAGIEKAWRMARVHTQQAVDLVDDKVGGARDAAEGWVRKGK